MDYSNREKIISDLQCALKSKGLWRTAMPTWCYEFDAMKTNSNAGFFEWLQFVYLPNAITNQYQMNQPLIVLQAKQFAADQIMDEEILNLLIALNAL